MKYHDVASVAQFFVITSQKNQKSFELIRLHIGDEKDTKDFLNWVAACKEKFIVSIEFNRRNRDNEQGDRLAKLLESNFAASEFPDNIKFDINLRGFNVSDQGAVR